MSKQKITALYVRINHNGNSDILETQIEYLKNYASKNEFDNIAVFADEGYSGNNFDRPNWNRLVAEIKNGNVETLIVKSLSRIGRNSFKVMEYQKMFLDVGVRLIAINDNLISAEDNRVANDLQNAIVQLCFPKRRGKIHA